MIENSLKFNSINKTANNTLQEMKILNYGFSFNWNQKYNSKLSQNSTIYYSVYDYNYERNRNLLENEFDAFKKLNRIVESGADFNFKYKVNDELNLDFGYQMAGKDV